MKLVSRSGGIKLTTSDAMIFSAPSLVLSANQLFIPRGIQYFDMEPGQEPGFENRTNVLTQSDVRRSDDLPATTTTENERTQLIPYHLVVTGGLISACH